MDPYAIVAWTFLFLLTVLRIACIVGAVVVITMIVRGVLQVTHSKT